MTCSMRRPAPTTPRIARSPRSDRLRPRFASRRAHRPRAHRRVRSIGSDRHVSAREVAVSGHGSRRQATSGFATHVGCSRAHVPAFGVDPRDQTARAAEVATGHPSEAWRLLIEPGMTKSIETIEINDLTSVTGGTQMRVDIGELVAALSGGAKT